jgi:hypothetical protein
MSSESHDLFCPKCNILVSARVIASGHGGFSSVALNPEDVPDAEYHGDSYSVALCGRCNSPFLLKESRYGVPGEFETITESQLLYPNESRLPLDGVPEPVRHAYEQATCLNPPPADPKCCHPLQTDTRQPMVTRKHNME